MFNRTSKPQSRLEVRCEEALDALKDHKIDSKEYGEILDRVVKLHNMKEEEKPDFVSKDTQAKIAANLAAVLMIISYERLNLITSKAMPFVDKQK